MTAAQSPEPAVEASYPPTPQSVPQSSTHSPPMLTDENSLPPIPSFAASRQQQPLKIEAPISFPAMAGLMTPVPSPAPMMNNPSSAFSSMPEPQPVQDLVDESDLQMSFMELLTDSNTMPDLDLPTNFLTSTAVTLSLPTPVDSTASMLSLGDVPSMPQLQLTHTDLLSTNIGSTMSLSPPADSDPPKPLSKAIDISTEDNWNIIDGVIKCLENIMPPKLIKPFTYLIVLARSRDTNLLKIFYRCQQECLALNESIDNAVLRMQKMLLNILPILAQQANSSGSNILQPQAATGMSH